MDFKNGMGAFAARVMQAVLPKRDEVPLLFLQDKKLAENLQKLLASVNMPTGDSPEAEIHLKLFGNLSFFI